MGPHERVLVGTRRVEPSLVAVQKSTMAAIDSLFAFDDADDDDDDEEEEEVRTREQVEQGYEAGSTGATTFQSDVHRRTSSSSALLVFFVEDDEMKEMSSASRLAMTSVKMRNETRAFSLCSCLSNQIPGALDRHRSLPFLAVFLSVDLMLRER